MLLDVYNNLKTRIGFKDSERNLIVAKLNDAWKEIYDSVDLPESRDEKVFDVNVASQVITLPWFVENIRKIRWYDPRLPLDVDAQGNRYNDSVGNELWIKKWRKVKKGALARSIDNYTTLKVSVPLAESEIFSVTVKGQTTNSAYSAETLTFAVGELEKETTGNFVEVQSISKNVTTASDVTIKDASDNILMVIPNHLKTFKYYTIQILDQLSSTLQQNFSSVEVYFKYAFHPVENDEDEFLFENKYDMAVLWKYLEQNKNNYMEVAAAQEKCKQVIDNVIKNEADGVVSKINFKRNPFFSLPYRMRRGM